MTANDIDTFQATLEARYTHILNTRMQDVPVVNPDLSVKAVGFQVWGECRLGVLVTPWFMNLMLLPLDKDCESWQEFAVGSKQRHGFPSGSYEFTVGFEEQLGRYQSCALFSPMFEFEDQQKAVDVATEIMTMLMDEENVDDSGSSRQAEIVEQWYEPADSADVKDAQEAVEPIEAEAPVTMTRRDLLRGSLRGDRLNTSASKEAE